MIAEQEQDRYQMALARAVQRKVLTWRELLARLSACRLQEVTSQGILIVAVLSEENYWWLSHGHWGAWLSHVTGEHINFVMEQSHA